MILKTVRTGISVCVNSSCSNMGHEQPVNIAGRKTMRADGWEVKKEDKNV